MKYKCKESFLLIDEDNPFYALRKISIQEGSVWEQCKEYWDGYIHLSLNSTFIRVKKNVFDLYFELIR